MEEFFVEMDSYAIAFFGLALRGGKEGGNSMGLILEARSPFLPFISTSLNLWVFCASSCASLSEQKRKAARCVRSNGPGFIQNSVQ